MVIRSSVAERGAKKARIHRHTYTFARAVDLPPGTPSASLSAARSLLSGHIAPGDPIAISLEPGLVSLARGFVLDLQAEAVTVGLDGELDERVLRERLDARLDPSRPGNSSAAGRLHFRIDKDELATGMGRIRDNLAQLFLASTASAGPASSLRSLIVNLAPPTFDPSLAPTPAELPAHLNADQRAAVERVLTARDYALILGMPGTGKSTTVVEVVRALVGQGKTVLLTSYTHSAVDTIVGKLAAAGGVDLLRLGNPDKVRRLCVLGQEAAARLTQMFSVGRFTQRSPNLRSALWDRLRAWSSMRSD
jgi:DNA replication ATP-dependent helicase Dna2